MAQSMKTYTVPRAGADLYVEEEGSGDPVLLLHGGLGHMGWFSDLRAHLVSNGWRVVLMDSRGMGRSSLGTEVLSYGAEERDAWAVLDALKIKACAVIGFSDGGIVGYRMAALGNGRLTRLVTIGSRWSAENGRGRWKEYETYSRATILASEFKFLVDDYDRLNPDSDFDRLIAQITTMWRDSGPDGHPEATISRITIPVLVTMGDSDWALSVGDAATARATIEGASLLVVPSASHFCYRERPDIFVPALDRFLGTTV